MDMFQFIWGFLIGIGVGFILGLLIAKRVVKDTIRKVSIYRSINIKDKGYRLYNSINGSYIVLKLESFKDMRTFTGILTKELEDINQFI